MTEQLQRELEEINKEELALKEKKKQFQSKLSSQGYRVEKGKIVKNEKVWALVWDLDYYSSYVGEKGVLHDYYEGAAQITEETYLEMVEAFKTKDEEQFLNLFWDVLELEEYILTGSIDRGIFTIKDNGELHWKAHKSGGYNIGELFSHSYFEIKKMTQDAIKKVKTVEKTDVFE